MFDLGLVEVCFIEPATITVPEFPTEIDSLFNYPDRRRYQVWIKNPDNTITPVGGGAVGICTNELGEFVFKGKHGKIVDSLPDDQLMRGDRFEPL